MPRPANTQSQKDRRIFFAICVLLLAAGVGIIWRYPRDWPLHGLAGSVAHALVIAGILALTVDNFLKAQLLNEVLRSAAKYLFGFHPPNEMWERVFDMVDPLVRHNWEQRCRLIPVEKGQVKAEIEVTWEMVNYSATPRPYAPSLSFDTSENPEITDIRCETTDTKAAFALSGEALQQRGQPVGDSITAKGKQIQIQPRSRCIKYRIWMRYSVTPDVPLNITAMAMPTIGVLVRVEAPESLNPRIVAMAKETIHQGNYWEWRQLFMPGEHFTLKWERVGDKPAEG